MEIEGMIIANLGPKEGISKAGNPWKKNEWVLETIGQYPRKVKFTVFGDRVNTVNFEVGGHYIVQVDVESREYNGNWYTDLMAYSARKVDNNMTQPGAPTLQSPDAGPVFQKTTAEQPAQYVPQNPFPPQAGAAVLEAPEQDDLPF